MATALRKVQSTTDPSDVKQYLDFSWRDYAWPLAFMLSASMVGLQFPIGYILILLVLVNRWVNNKYDFIIQITLFCGGYSLLLPDHDLYFPFDKVLFIFCILLLISYRKIGIEQSIAIWIAAYCGFVILFAFLAEVGLRAQIDDMINWLSIVFFIIPIASFGRKMNFDIHVFLRRLFLYLFIFCVFYVLDGLILCGHIFFPRDASALYYGHWTTFYSIFARPFSFNFLRVWPQGLYIALPCVYALARYYKLHWWQWVLFLLALFVCRTFSLYITLLVAWIVAMPDIRSKLIYFGVGIFVFLCVYFVDSEPVQTYDAGMQSTLRVRSSVQQFTDLINAQDEEDLSKFGSNRMIVVLPALDQLYEMQRQWLGVGFISNTKDVKSKYIIRNDALEDENMREMVMTKLEIVPIRIFITVGWLGLILHFAFFIFLWIMVRPLKYSGLFATVLVGFFMLGLGGFSGLIYYTGLYMTALTLAAVVLQNRSAEKGIEKRNLKQIIQKNIIAK